MNFVIPAIINRGVRTKPIHANLYIEADDREDALFLVHHGVIEMNVRKTFPYAKVKYDIRKMRRQIK